MTRYHPCGMAAQFLAVGLLFSPACEDRSDFADRLNPGTQQTSADRAGTNGAAGQEARKESALRQKYEGASIHDVPVDERPGLARALCGSDPVRAAGLSVEATAASCTEDQLAAVQDEWLVRARRWLASAAEPPCFECDRSPGSDAETATKWFADYIRLGGSMAGADLDGLVAVHEAQRLEIDEHRDMNTASSVRHNVKKGNTERAQAGLEGLEVLAADYDRVGMPGEAQRVRGLKNSLSLLVEQVGVEWFDPTQPTEPVAVQQGGGTASGSNAGGSRPVEELREMTTRVFDNGFAEQAYAAAPAFSAWEPYSNLECAYAVADRGTEFTVATQCRNPANRLFVCTAGGGCLVSPDGSARCSNPQTLTGELLACVALVERIVASMVR